MNKTFIIEFTIIHINGNTTPKKCKMHKCSNGVHAQVKLEEHLKKNVTDFKQLIVVSCTEDFTLGSIFDNMDKNNANLDSIFDIFNGSKKK